MRPQLEVDTVLALVRAGVNDCVIARRTGIPRTTVRDWRRGLRRAPRSLPTWATASSPTPPKQPYAYLLGMYLGDGCISATHRPSVWKLRIFCDVAYPAIIDECCDAMEAVFPEKHAHRLLKRDCSCVEVSMHSKHWLLLFPQHGPGRKHRRHIRLAVWQQRLVDEFPGSLLRGLIHSDGCRIIACERKNSRVRYAPRYVFSNRSDDIKRIFCDACDALGIHWTRPNAKSVAIYRLASVARLDEFVGPKR